MHSIQPNESSWFDSNDSQEDYLTVWVQTRDGDDLYHEDFDNLDELYRQWPYAEHVYGNEFVAWVGGKA